MAQILTTYAYIDNCGFSGVSRNVSAFNCALWVFSYYDFHSCCWILGFLLNNELHPQLNHGLHNLKFSSTFIINAIKLLFHVDASDKIGSVSFHSFHRCWLFFSVAKNFTCEQIHILQQPADRFISTWQRSFCVQELSSPFRCCFSSLFTSPISCTKMVCKHSVTKGAVLWIHPKTRGPARNNLVSLPLSVVRPKVGTPGSGKGKVWSTNSYTLPFRRNGWIHTLVQSLLVTCDLFRNAQKRRFP